jgi:aquaporin Z
LGNIEAETTIPLKKRFIAELIGAFGLVFAGVGSSQADSLSGHALGKLAVALAPGLLIMIMTYALDKISGAYFNPAISICYTLSKHLKPKDLPFYIIAQLLGAILASLLVTVTVGHVDDSGATLPKGKGGWEQSFALEATLTFFLMFVSIAMKEEKPKSGYKSFGGIAIGTTIILDDLVGMDISGASMNPARSFGPALVFGDLSYNWVYWLAPILGAVIALSVFKAIENKIFFSDKMHTGK